MTYAAELERLLFQYALGSDVSDTHRAYNENTRVLRFREHYRSVLLEQMFPVFPRLFTHWRELSVDEIVAAGLKTGTVAKRRRRWRLVLEALVTREPKAWVLHDLLALDVAHSIARARPWVRKSEAVESLLAMRSVPARLRPQFPAFVFPVFGSTPELLRFPFEGSPLLSSAVRSVRPRVGAVFRVQHGLRLHVGADPSDLVERVREGS